MICHRDDNYKSEKEREKENKQRDGEETFFGGEERKAVI